MESDVGASVSVSAPFLKDIEYERPEKQFILALEKLPILWDKAHPRYTNKMKRIEALRQLLVILKKIKPDATLEHVKMRINSIRSNYRRELKKVLASQRSTTDPDEAYTPRSWSFELLGFLYNNETLENQMLDSSDATEEHSGKTEITYDSDTASRSSGVYFEYTTQPSKKIKITKSESQNDPLDSTNNCAVSPEPSTSVSYHNSQPAPNSTNYIAFEWAETLSRLDPIQRLYAKKAINDILFEAELGNLNRTKQPSSDEII